MKEVRRLFWLIIGIALALLLVTRAEADVTLLWDSQPNTYRYDVTGKCRDTYKVYVSLLAMNPQPKMTGVSIPIDAGHHCYFWVRSTDLYGNHSGPSRVCYFKEINRRFTIPNYKDCFEHDKYGELVTCTCENGDR